MALGMMQAEQWIRDVLGVRLWAGQLEVVRAVECASRVAVRSGHKVGKSACVAALALWWVCTREGARVVLMAPTGRQVRQVLFREVRRMYNGANTDLGGKLYDMPDRGLQFEDGREIVGFSSDAPENLAGWSGPNMMFVLDESSGVSEDIYEAVLGNCAAGAKLVMISNPTKTSGFFYDAFHGKARFWTTLHISSTETPNITGREDAIPGLATQDWITETGDEYGIESPLYQIRVLGEFPTQASNSVIGIEDVTGSVARWKAWKESGGISEGGLELGVDPARFGDDESVVAARRGQHVIGLWAFRNLDNVQLAEQVQAIVAREKRYAETPTVRVDSIGIGSGVVDVLRRDPYLSVVGVNVSEVAYSVQYERKRDQVWYALRDWIRCGGCIPDDAKLQGELVAPTYSMTGRDRIKVESKDEMKARLKRSPDRADALGLAVFRDFGHAPSLNGPIGIGHRRI